MKINKYVEDLRTKSAAELNEELVAAKKELFNLRFQNATNQLDNTSRIYTLLPTMTLEVLPTMMSTQMHLQKLHKKVLSYDLPIHQIQ